GEAAQGHPVRVRGVVTYYDPEWNTLFVQDESAGIYVNVGGLALDLNLGQWIDLEGCTAPGDFAPTIALSRFQILGQAPLPQVQPYSLKQVYSGTADSQWIRLHGVVQSV